MNTRINHETKTIRPLDAAGNAFFGLDFGTNGTAAIGRRVVAEHSSNGVGYTWVKSSGAHALGLTLVPTERSHQAFSSPWEGR